MHQIRPINVLLIGESRYSSSLCHPLLTKLGCTCHIAESCKEIVHILSVAKLDIVLSLNPQQSLAELTALLAGSCSIMFHKLPAEEGCWWLPDVRSGESCLGAPAFSSSEFTRALADIVREMTSEAAARRPTAI
jgi:hypothetical protein